MQFEVRFKLEKETRGALRYLEVDENGEASSKPGQKSARCMCARVRSNATRHIRKRCASSSKRSILESRS